MDQDLLVDTRVEDGQKFLSELARTGFDVTVAFWVRIRDEDIWYLYVGSTSADADQFGAAWGIVYACMRRIPESSLALSEIMLVPISNPICLAAMAVRDRHPVMVPTWFHGKRLCSLDIEEAYIYPNIDLSKPVVISVVRDVKMDQHAKTITVFEKQVTLPPGTIVSPRFTIEYSPDHPTGKLSEKSLEDAIKSLPEGWTHKVVVVE